MVGIGAAYYRVVPKALNITVGAKLLMSLPTAVVRAFAADVGEIIDPLLTAAFVARVPIASSNYAITLIASTNGRLRDRIFPHEHNLAPLLAMKPNPSRPRCSLSCRLALPLLAACASRNYTYYLLDPPVQKHPALSQEGTLTRPFGFGSTTVMKVRWNDGNLITEVDVPVLTTGQRIVIEHGAGNTNVKTIPRQPGGSAARPAGRTPRSSRPTAAGACASTRARPR